MGQTGRLTYALARPALFALDPERAHAVALAALDRIVARPLIGGLAATAIAGPRVQDPFTLLGLRFPNRVGLAAGLDKDARHVDGLAALGFGFLELGTVTPRPQPGNPKPRMFRLPRAEALINRFGFNNDGIESFLAAVAASRCWRTRHGGAAAMRPVPRADRSAARSAGTVLGLNIGKNATTPIERAADDYLIGLRRAMPAADYIVVNISSPNTANLRQLQAAQELDSLLAALDTERTRLARETPRSVPLLLKVAPDLDDGQIDAIAAALRRYAIDGVIATNTTLAREAVASLPHGAEAGGLSGRPVFAASNRVIRALRQALPAGFPIIGVGGILSGADAIEKVRCGADLVQIYTGLIYRGPGLVAECADAIRTMARD